LKVYLVRHALAVDPGAQLADGHRYLSEKGRRGIREVGRRLREEGIEFDCILTSPLVRAVQTAELLAERVDYLGGVETLPSLGPGIPPRLAAAELPSRGVAVAVVGHEPGMSNLGAYLTGKPSFPPFRPGQIACIEDGQPRWFIHPDGLELAPLLLA
jgi:phosphohistidine phosphatase